MYDVIAAIAGAGAATGFLLAVRGLAPVGPEPSNSERYRLKSLSRAQGLRLGAALLTGALLWLITGWVVAVVLAPFAVLGLPHLVGGEKEAARAIERLEAVEEWVRQLASRLSAGIVVEQALVSSAHTAPTAIRDDVARLGSRLQQGWRTAGALHGLAEDLASPVGDLVTAELTLAATRRGSGVSQSLTQLAELVAEEVAMHRQVDAERARPRLTARLVTIIAVVAAAGLSLSGDFMEPYASPAGQAFLAVLATVFAAAVLWMRRMTATRPGPRFLAQPSTTGASR